MESSTNPAQVLVDDENSNSVDEDTGSRDHFVRRSIRRHSIYFQKPKRTTSNSTSHKPPPTGIPSSTTSKETPPKPRRTFTLPSDKPKMPKQQDGTNLAVTPPRRRRRAKSKKRFEPLDEDYIDNYRSLPSGWSSEGYVDREHWPPPSLSAEGEVIFDSITLAPTALPHFFISTAERSAWIEREAMGTVEYNQEGSAEFVELSSLKSVMSLDSSPPSLTVALKAGASLVQETNNQRSGNKSAQRGKVAADAVDDGSRESSVLSSLGSSISISTSPPSHIVLAHRRTTTQGHPGSIPVSYPYTTSSSTSHARNSSCTISRTSSNIAVPMVLDGNQEVQSSNGVSYSSPAPDKTVNRQDKPSLLLSSRISSMTLDTPPAFTPSAENKTPTIPGNKRMTNTISVPLKCYEPISYLNATPIHQGGPARQTSTIAKCTNSTSATKKVHGTPSPENPHDIPDTLMIDMGEDQCVNPDREPVGAKLFTLASSLRNLQGLLEVAENSLQPHEIEVMEQETRVHWRVNDMADFVEAFMDGS